jgi:Domain of unknown function (DUF4129)
MLAIAFEKNNLLWQKQLIQQRFGEWIELKLFELKLPRWPNLSISPLLLNVLFWGIVLAFGTLVIWRLMPLFRRTWVALQRSTEGQVEPRSPLPPRDLTVAEWLQQAKLLQQRGQYAEACRALYMAMLQRLNDTKVALHEPSRTDGEYLRLVRSLAQSHPYQTLIQTHEQICFGNAQVSDETYTLCQQAYREIEGQ